MIKLGFLTLLIILLSSCGNSIEGKIYERENKVLSKDIIPVSKINDTIYVLDGKNFSDVCGDGEIETKQLHYNIMDTDINGDIGEIIPSNFEILGCSMLVYNNGENIIVLKLDELSDNQGDISERKDILISVVGKFKAVYPSDLESVFNVIYEDENKTYINEEGDELISLENVKYENFGDTIKNKGKLEFIDSQGRKLVNFVGINGELSYGKKYDLSSWYEVEDEDENLLVFSSGDILSKKTGDKIIGKKVFIKKISKDRYFLSDGINTSYFYDAKNDSILRKIEGRENLSFVVSEDYIIFYEDRVVYGIDSSGDEIVLISKEEVNNFSNPIVELPFHSLKNNVSFSDFNPALLVNKLRIKGSYKENIYNFETKEFLLGEENKEIVLLGDKKPEKIGGFNPSFPVFSIFDDSSKVYTFKKSSGDNIDLFPVVADFFSVFMHNGEKVIGIYHADGYETSLYNTSFEEVGTCINSEYTEEKVETKYKTVKKLGFLDFKYEKVADGVETVKYSYYECKDKNGDVITTFD